MKLTTTNDLSSPAAEKALRPCPSAMTHPSCRRAARSDTAGGDPDRRRFRRYAWGRSWRRRICRQSGQATAEYALVMLAAAGLAGMVLAWAVGGNGVERLMNAVMDSIIAEVTG